MFYKEECDNQGYLNRKNKGYGTSRSRWDYNIKFTAVAKAQIIDKIIEDEITLFHSKEFDWDW
jgi:hypothetical protein